MCVQLKVPPSFLLQGSQDFCWVGASIRTSLMKLEGTFPSQPPNGQKMSKRKQAAGETEDLKESRGFSPKKSPLPQHL